MHSGMVLGFRDAQVFGGDVHELELEFGDALASGRLEKEGDDVGTILGTHCDDVIISCALEHFVHVVQVHSHAEGTIAAEVVETV